MATEVLRLDLGWLRVVDRPWPVHGFVVTHRQLGAVLVDTGCGGPEPYLREYSVVNRAVADALADHGLSPADVQVVINTHLHVDHCGQNPAFPNARFCVQRAELERVRREDGLMSAWLAALPLRFELFDGDVEVGEGLRVVTTPGHTAGHQSVVVTDGSRTELMVGDAAYTRAMWRSPEAGALPPGQADDVQAWRRSLQDLRALPASAVHFCHDASLTVAAPAAAGG